MTILHFTPAESKHLADYARHQFLKSAAIPARDPLSEIQPTAAELLAENFPVGAEVWWRHDMSGEGLVAGHQGEMVLVQWPGYAQPTAEYPGDLSTTNPFEGDDEPRYGACDDL